MATILVIGCGNPLRGDDGLGWHATRELARRLGAEAEARFVDENRVELAGLEILACQQLTMDLVETLRGVGRAAFIDVSVKSAPGALACEPVALEAPQQLVSHQFDPPTLLAAVRALYGARPEAVLFSVGAGTFDYGEQLSPEVAAALPHLVQAVSDWLAAPPLAL